MTVKDTTALISEAKTLLADLVFLKRPARSLSARLYELNEQLSPQLFQPLVTITREQVIQMLNEYLEGKYSLFDIEDWGNLIGGLDMGDNTKLFCFEDEDADIPNNFYLCTFFFNFHDEYEQMDFTPEEARTNINLLLGTQQMASYYTDLEKQLLAKFGGFILADTPEWYEHERLTASFHKRRRDDWDQKSRQELQAKYAYLNPSTQNPCFTLQDLEALLLDFLNYRVHSHELIDIWRDLFTKSPEIHVPPADQKLIHHFIQLLGKDDFLTLPKDAAQILATMHNRQYPVYITPEECFKALAELRKPIDFLIEDICRLKGLNVDWEIGIEKPAKTAFFTVEYTHLKQALERYLADEVTAYDLHFWGNQLINKNYLGYIELPDHWIVFRILYYLQKHDFPLEKENVKQLLNQLNEEVLKHGSSC